MADPARVLLRLPADLHATLTQRAVEQGVSFNTYAVTLLAGGIGFIAAAEPCCAEYGHDGATHAADCPNAVSERWPPECTCSEDRNGGSPLDHAASCAWARAVE